MHNRLMLIMESVDLPSRIQRMRWKNLLSSIFRRVQHSANFSPYR